MKNTQVVGFILIVGIMNKAYAFGGLAGVPHLIKLVAESHKRHRQLQSMISQNKEQQRYLKQINSGLDQLNTIKSALPVKDENVLKELSSMGIALSTIKEIYGKIPESAEKAIQELHDNSIAESLKMNVDVSNYAKEQEKNAKYVSERANDLSPKGALRANAQTNAQILHTLNQLLKVNGQMLKLQSEKLALDNKQGKDSVSHFNTIGEDLKASGSVFRDSFKLPEFK